MDSGWGDLGAYLIVGVSSEEWSFVDERVGITVPRITESLSGKKHSCCYSCCWKKCDSSLDGKFPGTVALTSVTFLDDLPGPRKRPERPIENSTSKVGVSDGWGVLTSRTDSLLSGSTRGTRGEVHPFLGESRGTPSGLTPLGPVNVPERLS